MSWMGSKSTYDGPSLAERKQVRKASARSFYCRTSTSTSKMDLRQVFEEVGAVVTDVRIVYQNRESTGVAYVDVADDESIQKGLTLDNTELHEAPLRVRRNMSKESLRKLVKERAKEQANRPIISKVCFAFKQGKCTRGDSCKFSHSAETTQQAKKPDEPLRVCYNFLKGKCRLGERCKFAHSKDEIIAVSSSTSTSTSSSSDSGEAQQEVCRNFLKGRCTYDNCKFSHDTGNTSTESRKRRRTNMPETVTTTGVGRWEGKCEAKTLIKKKQKRKNDQEREKELSKVNKPELEKEVNALIKERQFARDEKNWARADQIRSQLKERGVVLVDTKKGAVWSVKKSK
jgi:hypothetical protein